MFFGGAYGSWGLSCECLLTWVLETSWKEEVDQAEYEKAHETAE